VVVVVWHTFYWLLREEIMDCRFDPRAEGLNLTHHLLPLLQDQLSRQVRMLRLELLQIMAHATSHIHYQYRLPIALAPTGKALLNGVEPRVCPTGLALAVAGHVVVEALQQLGMLTEVHPEGNFGVVAELEGPVGNVVRVFVGGFLEVSGDLVEGGTCDVVPVKLRQELVLPAGWAGRADV
jgi:hypothetical protein